MPSTGPPDRRSGTDQHERSPAAAAAALNCAHLGSSRRSSLTTARPRNAAAPQVPTWGPIAVPSMASMNAAGMPTEPPWKSRPSRSTSSEHISLPTSSLSWRTALWR